MRSPQRLTEILLAKASPAPTRRIDIDQHCFAKQAAFVRCRAKQFTACTSRRAGKSEGCAAILLSSAQERTGSASVYVTKTRLNAKRIIWGVLKRVNAQYALGGRANESELSMTMPNGSVIYLAGANNREEIEKFRGVPLGVVVLDESQLLVGYLQQLVDEILAPTLMDYDGSLVLVGTPGPVPVGYFHDCCHSPEWGHFAWTVFDNPHIERKSGKTPLEHLNAEMKRRGVEIEDPIIQREWFGRWVLDTNSLVFRYSEKINHRAPPKHGNHVVGVDLGFDDADAIGVLGWSDPGDQAVDLVHEEIHRKQTITELGNLLVKVNATYSPLAIVVDTGGLGRKIEEELRSRWGLPVEAAEKERKLEHIELLNDALRSGRLFAPKTSRFAQDCMLVEWDKTNPEKWEISDAYHSDICDAVLYAYRRALHWLAETPKNEPAFGTAEWARQEAAKQEAAHLERLARAIESERREREEQIDLEDRDTWGR